MPCDECYVVHVMQSVKMLMNDFDNADKPIYKGAHVFFTEGQSSTT